MRFRWKLAFLLVIIALVPIVGMRVAGVRFVRNLADQLVSQAQENRIDNMRHRLTLLVDSYSEMLWRYREQIEMALMLQSDAVERALAQNAPPPAKVYFAHQFNHGVDLPDDTAASSTHYRIRENGRLEFLRVSRSTQVFHIAPGLATSDALRADIARLATLTGMYRKLAAKLADGVFWQTTVLHNGVAAAYPAHNGIPRRLDSRRQAWFEQALTHEVPWSNPYVDPETRQIVLAAIKAVRRPDGRVAGVTSIVYPVSQMLNRRVLIDNMPPETTAFMAYLDNDPASGKPGARIFARQEHTDIKYRRWRAQVALEWVDSSDAGKFEAFMQDFTAGRKNLRRMSYKGRDSLWAYGPNGQGAFLILITPYATILKPAQQARGYVYGLIERTLTITRYAIGGVVLIVFVLALAFSQTVTRPLAGLVAGARKLARGDFDARVAVRSSDEFGDMARVFNSLGPRLKEHTQMRHSLVLAKQMQQSLLPAADPVVPGLDVAGSSVYCDETGGDYYDYLNLADTGNERLTVVVGDVAGHGLPTALLMTTARALLRQRASRCDHIEAILNDVNCQLNLDVEASGQFMALFICEIDTAHQKVRWVRAGHEPGILFDPPTDTFTELSGKGLPLGVFADTTYNAHERAIADGQILILGTDGIGETINAQGRMFGKDALHAVIRANADRPARQILTSVVKALDRFRHPVEQKDDITLVIVKILSQPE